MQNSTTFVQTAEVKQKYDGKFTHVGEFNRKFEARLRQRNPLAMSIINGTIKLKPVKTMHKTYYEHAVAIITAFFLAIQIMITVDQTKINYSRLPFTRVQGSWSTENIRFVRRKNKVTSINCGEGFLNKEFEESIENFGKLAHDAREEFGTLILG